MVFNRPEKTKRVFEAIKLARPSQLLIIADGPRNSTDEVKCGQVKEIITAGIDWPCQLLTNYSEKNLRPRKRISSGLDWVFSQVEEAIILEDDCLPEPTFFRYCQELLDRYRNDDKIMHISGTNFANWDKKFSCDDSYYFSTIGLIQGWATWRRAWENYDVDVKTWPEVKKSNLLKTVLGDAARVDYYNYLFDQYYRNAIDSWDSQWFLARWINHGLSIVPKNNLIRNIGFDSEAFTQMTDQNDPRARLASQPIEFPLKHPATITVNKEADDYVFRYCIGINLFFKQRLVWFAKSRLPGVYKLLKRIKPKN